MLDYTRNVGKVDGIKQVLQWMESQRQVADTIKQKYDNKDSYAI